MVRVAVCGEESIEAPQLERMVLMGCRAHNIAAEVDVYYTGAGLVSRLETCEDYDMIFIDIDLPDIDGLKLGRSIRLINANVILIYISSKTGCSIRLFEVGIFRFLAKPLDDKGFMEVFQKAYDLAILKTPFFGYSYKKNIYKIRLCNIIYFESRGRIVNIVTSSGRESFYAKLNDVEERVKYQKLYFLRIHKSFLVNMEYAERLIFDRVCLKNGDELPISKEHQKKMQAWYLFPEE